MEPTAEENSAKKKLIIVLLGIGVAVVAILIWMFFLQGEASGW